MRGLGRERGDVNFFFVAPSRRVLQCADITNLKYN